MIEIEAVHTWHTHVCSDAGLHQVEGPSLGSGKAVPCRATEPLASRSGRSTLQRYVPNRFYLGRIYQFSAIPVLNRANLTVSLLHACKAETSMVVSCRSELVALDPTVLAKVSQTPDASDTVGSEICV